MKHLTITLLLIILPFTVLGQETLTFQPTPHVQGGLLVGGLITFNNIAFAPGMGFYGGLSLWQSDKVEIRASLGYENYRHIRSWPFYGELRRVLGEKKQSYFLAQAGYAFAYNQGFVVSSAFQMRGGLLGSIGIGKTLSLSPSLNLEIDLSYKAQRNTLTYPSVDGVSAAVIETSQYHFLVLRVGVGKR